MSKDNQSSNSNSKNDLILKIKFTNEEITRHDLYQHDLFSFEAILNFTGSNPFELKLFFEIVKRILSNKIVGLYFLKNYDALYKKTFSENYNYFNVTHSKCFFYILINFNICFETFEKRFNTHDVCENLPFRLPNGIYYGYNNDFDEISKYYQNSFDNIILFYKIFDQKKIINFYSFVKMSKYLTPKEIKKFDLFKSKIENGETHPPRLNSIANL